MVYMMSNNKIVFYIYACGYTFFINTLFFLQAGIAESAPKKALAALQVRHHMHMKQKCDRISKHIKGKDLIIYFVLGPCRYKLLAIQM